MPVRVTKGQTTSQILMILPLAFTCRFFGPKWPKATTPGPSFRSGFIPVNDTRRQHFLGLLHRSSTDGTASEPKLHQAAALTNGF